VARVDIANHTIEVGRLDDVLISVIGLDRDSITFAREPLGDGTRVLAQWSAHGVAQPAILRDGDTWHLELERPARPVAAGQTVVLYRVDDPTIVEGAAIVTLS